MRIHAARIDRLNVYPVPDGDTGTNMSRTLDAVVAEMDGAADDLVATCDAIAHGALMGARGNSGVITSQLLRGMAGSLKADETPAMPSSGDASAMSVAAALSAASAASYQAVRTPVEGTILTVARRAAEGATEAAADGEELAATLRAARAAAAEALDDTPRLLPVLADAGVVDAGGAGFLLLLDAALHVVAGDPLPEPPVDHGGAGPLGAAFGGVATRPDGPAHGLDVTEQRYEVMYLCDLPDDRIEGLKSSWGDIGDSIVVAGGDGLWNCHVHTNDIGAAIEAALELDGRPHQIRVSDLFEEVAAEHAVRDSSIRIPAASPDEPDQLPAVHCAVVAVSSGPGIAELFTELGVQVIVGGGQASNPSTAELLAAVERVNADQVIVLPNNKNVIPVAEQLDAVSTKTVRVVPTRSMPQGVGALIEYDPEAGAPLNRTKMAAAAESIATGEVTRAVRATTTPVGPVREGDWIGVVRGDGIVAVAAGPVGAATGLLSSIITEDREIVTILIGADAATADTEAITAWLKREHPGVAVETHVGGQPLYPFLFGVE